MTHYYRTSPKPNHNRLTPRELVVYLAIGTGAKTRRQLDAAAPVDVGLPLATLVDLGMVGVRHDAPR